MKREGKQKKKKILMVTFLLIASFAILFFSLQIRTVEMSGNERYTKEQIENLIFDTNLSRNSIYCYYQSAFRPHKSIPFVEDYKIVFRSPTKVEIILYEKSVVGYVSYMNSLMYFDKDGIIVESTNEKLEGVPLISGLKFGHIVLHKSLPVEEPQVFNEILNLTQVLSVYGIIVDKIHYNSDHEAQLTIKNLVVKLGTNAQISGKISELNDILRDYAELSGTLYLDTYDEANTNPMYRFQRQ